MANETMVTIPLEEYIELRRKAGENLYLADRLGQFEQRMWHLENSVEEVARIAMERGVLGGK
jgi:hypothetical protein